MALYIEPVLFISQINKTLLARGQKMAKMVYKTISLVLT